jgi:hypothetical protein
MNKPTLGVVVGAALGVLDGASAWAYPEARAMILAIVVSSTIKGALTGLAAGLVARRVRSIPIGIAVGIAIGSVLSVAAAASAPAAADGSHHYAEIVLPGMLLGAIVGFATQRFPTGANSWTRPGLTLLMFVVSTFAAAAEQAPSASDPLQPVAFLVGTWRGTSSGTPGEGTVEREYARALNGRFIQIRNRTTYPPQAKNAKGEVHEDIGVISFDRVRARFVLRQFHVEGFVNQYSAQQPTAGGARWIFTSEAIENIQPGWRARETYTLADGENNLEEVFELAEPGKDFEVYSRAKLTRVK